tara:strand:- start:766 stop:1338 length:573 start_codon:yes stop_codon:yes gene_type:complete
MNPKRIHVKLFLEAPQSAPPDEVFQIFNNWIADTADEVLIDVADYSHIHNGPITLLVGHQADYSIDNANAEMGLLYCSKEALEGDLASQLRQAVTAALKACRRLEDDSMLQGKAKFRSDLEVATSDRLNFPNTPETLATFKTALESGLENLYGGANLTVENTSSPGDLPTLRVRGEGAHDTSSLLANLGA